MQNLCKILKLIEKWIIFNNTNVNKNNNKTLKLRVYCIMFVFSAIGING